MNVVVAGRAYDLSDNPYDGFIIRHLDIIEAVAREHSVSLLVLRQPDDRSVLSPRLSGFDRVEVPLSFRSNSRFARLRFALLSGCGRGDDESVDTAVAAAVRDLRAELAVTLGPWLSTEFRPVYGRLPTLHLFEEDLLQMHEIASQSLQARMFRAVEQFLLARHRNQPVEVGVIAEPEMRRAERRYPGSKVRHVPYVLPEGWPVAGTRSDGTRIIVTGVLAQERNVEGLVEVLAEIQRRRLDQRICFDLVSRAGLHELLRPFVDGAFVRLVEPEGHLYEHYRRARAALVPATRATGLKTTVVQAWAAGCPVVCFPASSNTLGRGCMDALLVGRNPSEIVDQLVRVIEEPDMATRIAARARDLLLSRYPASGQEAVVADVLRLLGVSTAPTAQPAP